MKQYSAEQINEFLTYLKKGKTMTVAATLAGIDSTVIAQRVFAGKRDSESPYRSLARAVMAAKISALQTQLDKLGGAP